MAHDVAVGMVEVVAVGPGSDGEGRLLAVEEVDGVFVVGHVHDARSFSEVESRREEADARRPRRTEHVVDVVLEGEGPSHLDAPRAADGHHLRGLDDDLDVDLVVDSPALGARTPFVDVLPSLRVVRRSIGCRVAREDRLVVLYALEHVDGDGVPARGEVRVGVHRQYVRFAAVEPLGEVPANGGPQRFVPPHTIGPDLLRPDAPAGRVLLGALAPQELREASDAVRVDRVVVLLADPDVDSIRVRRAIEGPGDGLRALGVTIARHGKEDRLRREKGILVRRRRRQELRRGGAILRAVVTGRRDHVVDHRIFRRVAPETRAVAEAHRQRRPRRHRTHHGPRRRSPHVFQARSSRLFFLLVLRLLGDMAVDAVAHRLEGPLRPGFSRGLSFHKRGGSLHNERRPFLRRRRRRRRRRRGPLLLLEDSSSLSF
mmetsp:Transcript_14290/g.46633  ORF Transcript_14290/g.46633 Transcript_14290/m.46633 type:complete len:430 (+) Transcript_14290:309-1598(+)